MDLLSKFLSMVVSGSNENFISIREGNVFLFKTKTNSILFSSQWGAWGKKYGESKTSDSYDFRMMLSRFEWLEIWGDPTPLFGVINDFRKFKLDLAHLVLRNCVFLFSEISLFPSEFEMSWIRSQWRLWEAFARVRKSGSICKYQNETVRAIPYKHWDKPQQSEGGNFPTEKVLYTTIRI